MGLYYTLLPLTLQSSMAQSQIKLKFDLKQNEVIRENNLKLKSESLKEEIILLRSNESRVFVVTPEKEIVSVFF